MVNEAERVLAAMGYSVRRNVPYAGGFTTRHYGRPRQRVHAMQIEINRSIYMDEDSYRRSDRFAEIQGHLSQLACRLADFARDQIT